MKQRSERWTVHRLGFGCASGSSGAVDDASGTQDNKQNDICVIKKTKHSLRFRLPNANLYHGFRRFIISLKRVSRIFVYKIEMNDEEENDEGEGDMEIGYPTDVKHLTHIGWDGSTTVSKPGKQWENLTPILSSAFVVVAGLIGRERWVGFARNKNSSNATAKEGHLADHPIHPCHPDLTSPARVVLLVAFWRWWFLVLGIAGVPVLRASAAVSLSSSILGLRVGPLCGVAVGDSPSVGG
ncbi:hypothetical protein KSS87_020231 [Heliosperma pusillum]|nr:hypothetical protein KSS87_020231 [Heliosperma pusillum]